VLFFIHLETRRVNLAGFTPDPDQGWMEQQARNMTMEEWRCLRSCRYLLHDRVEEDSGWRIVAAASLAAIFAALP
jgi:hypothetical protein